MDSVTVPTKTILAVPCAYDLNAGVFTFVEQPSGTFPNLTCGQFWLMEDGDYGSSKIRECVDRICCGSRIIRSRAQEGGGR